VLKNNNRLGTIVDFNIRLAQIKLGEKGVSRRARLELGTDLALKPINQLELRNSINTWVSIGDDPYFEINKNPDFDGYPAWAKLRFIIKSNKQKNIAKVYLDYGEDYDEDHSVIMPYENGRLVTRVLYIPRPIKRIRFDPLEAADSFNVDFFKMQAIDSRQAKKHIISRLTSIQDYGLNNEKKIVSDLQKNAENVSDDLILQAYEKYEASYFLSSANNTYHRWINELEKPSLPDDGVLIEDIRSMEKAPIISLILPVYNTNQKYLELCIESVLNQKYPNWELCIADDASTLPHIRTVLEKYEGLDSRVRLVFREENGHISKASNSALEIASGDFVALLDHDDTLSPHALYFVAQAIEDNPGVQIIYSDEDKIDEQGQRFAPHFKSDWNPDLFYSQNYVCHLGVYRRELLETIGGFRTGVEGSQDQDLLLRCLPHVNHQRITHIPRVLYHWRTSEGSTAQSASAKSYTTQAGVKALQDHLREQGKNAVTVEAGLLPNTYRLRWPIPTPAPMVSLIIPTRDKKAVVELAVRSILDKTSYPNYEILLIDNGSQDSDALKWLEDIQKDPRVRVLRYDYPFNYSAINNFGAQFARGEVLGLVNNDVEVISPEWMTELTSHALRPEIGCVGAKLFYGDGRIQHAGVVLGIGGVAGHSHKYFARTAAGYSSRLCLIQNYPAVTGACLFVRKNVYEEVGGLNEMQLKIAFNDVDFCLRVQEQGLRNLWTPFAELYHHESTSRGAEDTPEKQTRFLQEVKYMKTRWAGEIARSRYYSPNLTRQREDFSIRES
jgi:glycosyltransferase involved in cell wall biosynthesis